MRCIRHMMHLGSEVDGIWLAGRHGRGKSFSLPRCRSDRILQEKQKIAAAVCLYQANNGGEWGEIRKADESGAKQCLHKSDDWDAQGFSTDRLPHFAVISVPSPAFKIPLPADRIAHFVLFFLHTPGSRIDLCRFWSRRPLSRHVLHYTSTRYAYGCPV